jgi:hypothetical protein
MFQYQNDPVLITYLALGLGSGSEEAPIGGGRVAAGQGHLPDIGASIFHTWDRFYKTSFWHKTFRINLHPQFLDNFPRKTTNRNLYA